MSVPQAIQDFVKAFYAASDVGPEGHQAYVSYYTPDTTLIMGPTEYKGTDGVMSFRQAGWEKVATRQHIVNGTFISPSDPDQIMLHGIVNYGMKDGTKKEGIEWAGWMNLVKDGGDYKLKHYQVWIR